ncbi:MAG TPA: S24 family peptidase [Clostridia bacterium]|nr:S24 family peptidase [Clostridia bacterium]
MNVLERMAALVREDPAITVAEIARRLGYSEEKSVYYWLEKARIKGIREFKRMVLTDHPKTPLLQSEPPKDEPSKTQVVSPLAPAEVKSSRTRPAMYQTGDAGETASPLAGKGQDAEMLKEKDLKTDGGTDVFIPEPGGRTRKVKTAKTVYHRPVSLNLPLITESELLWSLAPEKTAPSSNHNRADRRKRTYHRHARLYLPSKPGARSFALLVTSDSMRPLFVPQDVVVIDPDAPLEPGALVLARHGIKTPRPFVVSKIQGMPVLVDTMDVSFIRSVEEMDISIIGVVLALVRYYRS